MIDAKEAALRYKETPLLSLLKEDVERKIIKATESGVRAIEVQYSKISDAKFIEDTVKELGFITSPFTYNPSYGPCWEESSYSFTISW